MTLFVGGIHAVGKTFVLKAACAKLGLRHATASQLIREQRGNANWTTSRQVAEVDENQRALVAAVRHLEEQGDGLVLDGHFVLRRGVNIHEKIGIETFAALTVRCAILLEAPIPTVLKRLQERGDNTWTTQEIDLLAEAERQQAACVCEALGIPLISLSSPSDQDVSQAIMQLLR